MDFSTSSCNAKTQSNAEGLLKKRAATHIQNCGNRNTEEKQLPELMGGWGYYWGYRNYLSNGNNKKVEIYWDQGREI